MAFKKMLKTAFLTIFSTAFLTTSCTAPPGQEASPSDLATPTPTKIHILPEYNLGEDPYGFKVLAGEACASSYGLSFDYLESEQCVGIMEVYENGELTNTVSRDTNGNLFSPVGCSCGESFVQTYVRYEGASCDLASYDPLLIDEFTVTTDCTPDPEPSGSEFEIYCSDSSDLGFSIKAADDPVPEAGPVSGYYARNPYNNSTNFAKGYYKNHPQKPNSSNKKAKPSQSNKPGPRVCKLPPEPNTPIKDILKDRKGSIKNVPLKSGELSYDGVSKLTWKELNDGAKAREPGYQTWVKLLNDNRFLKGSNRK